MHHHQIVDSVNQATMASAEAVSTYGSYSELWPSERAALQAVRAEVAGRPILDLGVGGGRTVREMLELSSDYVGLDYTPAMVATCRARFPNVRFEHGDARHMPYFADAHFALVLFSCNGLCMVGHTDRLGILTEVHRVLAPGGVFVFSCHNRHSPDHDAGYVFPRFRSTRNPLRLAARSVRFAKDTAVSYLNYRRLSRHDLRGPDYSIINDRCHNYATMLYYISLDKQRQQLAAHGLFLQSAYDRAGHSIIADTTDPSICYLARKL